jgi:excisionase family DNA binding protein
MTPSTCRTALARLRLTWSFSGRNGTPRPARRYASVQATAELYQVDDKTVRRWISSGLITGYRVGSMLVRVDLDEVEAKVVEVIPAAAQAKQ